MLKLSVNQGTFNEKDIGKTYYFQKQLFDPVTKQTPNHRHLKISINKTRTVISLRLLVYCNGTIFFIIKQVFFHKNEYSEKGLNFLKKCLQSLFSTLNY